MKARWVLSSFQLLTAMGAMAGTTGACSSSEPSSQSASSGSLADATPMGANGSGTATGGSSGSGTATGGSSGSGAGGGSGSSGSALPGSGSAFGSGSASAGAAQSGSSGQADAGGSGSSSAGSSSGDSGTASSGSGVFAGDAGTPLGDAGANLVSIFDGTSLNGWIQVPASSWSVVNGTLHSLAPARGYLYTTKTYGDFRFVFTSRLVQDPMSHNPCVLFWGNAIGADALGAIQIQPPKGYMWDYRTTGPTANKSPDMFETKLPHPNLASTQWSQCEMLGIKATGVLRFACCQITGNAPCKATEIVDFKDPTAGQTAPLALQVHNAAMIEEFKNLYVESPVVDPTKLITTQ